MISTKSAVITSPNVDFEHRSLESTFTSGVGHGHQDDIVIVVMGGIGTGKSSFIKLLTGNARISDNLKSETSDVQVIRFVDPPSGRNVTIVDTPGFDESHSTITDVDMLKLANYLHKEHDERRKLNVLVYLQRISDPSFDGQSPLDLKKFRELPGVETYKNVVVLTTFWDRVSSNEEGVRREAQLKSNFFKDLVAGGATFMRHDRTIESTRQVFQHILSMPPIVTHIQREVQEGKSFAGTDKVHADLQQGIHSRNNEEEAEELHKLAIRAGGDIFRFGTKAVTQIISPGFAKLKFQFAHSDKFPPHLKSIPLENQTNALEIFDFSSLLETLATTFLPPEISSAIWGMEPEVVMSSMENLVIRNHELHSQADPDDWIGAMYYPDNIGLRDDWYKDALFGQQRFTGDNPTTITLASPRWIDEFKTASQTQRRADVTKLLTDSPQNCFVHDHSDFRSIMGLSPSAELKSEGRYGCSAVALFHLEPEGKLHPLAITLDYKGSIKDSVTIFNRRIASTTPGDEAGDWPWRYAKMCAQTSDWLRHEVTVHLVNTHLLEEVIIVAAYRTFQPNHILLQLLEPHWETTLSLNSQAREILVPQMLFKMVGLTAKQAYDFIKGEYNRFGWRESYVPNDLRRRGFPIEELDKAKYHNYGYARNIARMWEILRSFVRTVLTRAYGSDAQVAKDGSISAFCHEVRSQNGGQLASFPDIKTLEELIDTVTMCIHIASPQHTAVNYLQQYYQTFVPNKPAALYTQLPRSLAELQKFGEKDVLSALPIHRPKDWLLMAQVPHLLSDGVPDDSDILHYATTASKSSSTPQLIRDAVRVLKNDLEAFVHTVAQHSHDLDDKRTPYLVLDPTKTAVSILI